MPKDFSQRLFDCFKPSTPLEQLAALNSLNDSLSKGEECLGCGSIGPLSEYGYCADCERLIGANHD